MKTRMQPIGNAWQKLPRIVRDLSAELGKQIELEMHGADTELIGRCSTGSRIRLTHMVRNSADHGLENRTNARRGQAASKARSASPPITRAATSSSASPTTAADLNTEGSRPRRCRRSGHRGRAGEDDRAQIHKLIFAPGFSTAENVTTVSGRGVGMDVVRTNIDQIGGTIDVKSVSGEGSRVTIKIPLTLAIISALIVQAAGDRFRDSRRLSAVEAGAVACQFRAPHRAHQGRRGPEAAQQPAAADAPEEAPEDRRRCFVPIPTTASSW